MKQGSQLDGDSGDFPTSALIEQKAGPFVILLNSPKLKALLIVAVVAGTFLLYFAASQPNRFGFYRDDSTYVVMGKALAEGQGYRIISLPDDPVQAKSPPLYPLLLSVIWRLDDEFPRNLTAMMILTAGMAIGFLGLTYRYLVTEGYANRWQALLVVVLAAINWRTIVLATGIYSEMVYAALSVAALWIAEKYEKGRINWAVGSALGVVTGLAFLTRTAGVSLLAAMAVYYLFRRRPRGILPVAIAGMIVLAWIGWGYVNSPTIQNSNAGSYESYFQTFRAVIAHEGRSNLMLFLSVVARNALGLILISMPVVCLGLAYGSVFYFGFAFLFIASGFLRQIRSALRLMHIYIITYLSVHLLWPYTSYDRFLMPLLPFLLLFMLIEVQRILILIRKVLAAQQTLARRVSAAFIGLALVVLIGAFFYNYGLGVYQSLSLATLNKVPQPDSDDAEAIAWIKSHTDPSDVLICYRDPLYYLYTNRKSARSTLSREGGALQSSERGVDEKARELLQIAEENRGRYLVLTQSDFGLEYQPDLHQQGVKAFLEQNPQRFVPLFESSNGHSIIYRIDIGGV